MVAVIYVLGRIILYDDSKGIIIMFYCNECAKKKNWPVTMFKSAGTCEICGDTKECSEMPSSKLPRPRAKTAEEVRNIFLTHIKDLVRYWSELPNKSDYERCDGVAFSILSMIDGCGVVLPAMDIHLHPHPDDKEYHKSQGEDWYENGMWINDTMLHEEYVEK